MRNTYKATIILTNGKTYTRCFICFPHQRIEMASDFAASCLDNHKDDWNIQVRDWKIEQIA